MVTPPKTYILMLVVSLVIIILVVAAVVVLVFGAVHLTYKEVIFNQKKGGFSEFASTRETQGKPEICDNTKNTSLETKVDTGRNQKNTRTFIGNQSDGIKNP